MKNSLDASLYRVAEAFRPTMGIDESLLGKGTWRSLRTAIKKGFKDPRFEYVCDIESIKDL